MTRISWRCCPVSADAAAAQLPRDLHRDPRFFLRDSFARHGGFGTVPTPPSRAFLCGSGGFCRRGLLRYRRYCIEKDPVSVSNTENRVYCALPVEKSGTAALQASRSQWFNSVWNAASDRFFTTYRCGVCAVKQAAVPYAKVFSPVSGSMAALP